MNVRNVKHITVLNTYVFSTNLLTTMLWHASTNTHILTPIIPSMLNTKHLTNFLYCWIQRTKSHVGVCAANDYESCFDAIWAILSELNADWWVLRLELGTQNSELFICPLSFETLSVIYKCFCFTYNVKMCYYQMSSSILIGLNDQCDSKHVYKG